jgi:hypothetical protein
MKKIGLIGGGFQHAFSTTLWKKPKYFEWSKGNVEDITFFIDNAIIDGLNVECKTKCAWIVESRDIIPNLNDYVIKNINLIINSYDIIFTHDKSIYNLSEKIIYLPPHGYWVEIPKIYKKNKLISMISSNKNFSTGHRKRLSFVEKFKNSVDLYGRGFNEMDKKEDGLKDYMFSITVENDSYPTYWSEKILDCFVTGTVPIYYGSPDIGDYFNMDGIILLTEDFDITKINENEYYKRMSSIKDNFDRALQYNVIEDIIYEKWIK